MSSRAFFTVLCAGLVSCFTLTVQAQTFTWSNTPLTSDLGTSGNWASFNLPPNNATANLFFYDSTITSVTLSGSLAVNSLTFESFEEPYKVGSSTPDAFTLGINGGGITVNAVDYDGSYEPTIVEFTAGLPLQLLAAQTWTVTYGSALSVYGGISGAGGSKLSFDGAVDVYDQVTGQIHLSGNNTFAGGTDINGWLTFHLGSNAAFGTGKITLNADGITLGSGGGDHTLANAVDFKAVGTFRHDGTKGSLTLGGALTLFEDLNLELNGKGTLILSGNIGESGGSRTLHYFGSYIEYGNNINGTVLLSGTNSYTGGTVGHEGSLIFASAASIPAAGSLLAYEFAYLGVASTVFPTSLQVDYLNRFDKANTTGAIGFDTDPAQGSPNNFSGTIDLSGFHADARLSTATRAIISGVITPQGTEYRFGMGGGALEVASNLTGARNVRAFSGYEAGIGHLLVRLTGTNNYTDGTTVAAAGLIFGTPASLPATGDLTLGYQGYIGLQLAADVPPTGDTTVPDFLNRFGYPENSQSTVGFDSAGLLTPRIINAPVDFTGLANFNNSSFSLGTTTNVTITGLITMPFGYRFNTTRGGQLTIASILSGSNDVTLGGYNGGAPISDPESGLLSTITLSGDNTYAGFTYLRSGRLVVGQSNSGIGTNPTTALGSITNKLRADGLMLGDYLPSIRLEAASPGIIIANPIELYNSGLELNGANSFTLSGTITDDGDYPLTKFGAGTVTLTGNNSFSGGFYLGGGNVTFTGNSSAGTGPLGFGASGGTATFESIAPVIGGLSGEGQVSLAASSTLTINTNYNSESVFTGVISGSGASLVINYYSDELTFTGANTYSGGTTIADGTLRLGNGGTTGSIVGNVTLGNYSSVLAFNRSDAVTFPGVVSGTGDLRQDGPGTLTLTGANTYSGSTHVNAGTLLLGAANALPTTAGLSVAAGATFDLGGFSATIRELSGDGTILLGSNSLTSNSTSSSTFSGNIQGTGGLTLASYGSLTLLGDNSYSGDTILSDGQLTLGNGGTTGSVAGNIINNSTLTIHRGDSYNYFGLISGTGNVTSEGYGGTVTLHGANTYTGGTTINSGTLVAGHDTALGTGGIFVASYATLVVADEASLANPVTLTPSSILAGHGFIESATITADAILSPGSALFNAIGSLELNHLELDSGGIYEWQIQDPNSATGYDLVNVGIDAPLTLVVNANAGGKFTLRIISLDLSGFNGDLQGIDPEHGLYTWTLFTYDTLQTTLPLDAFDPDAFLLDLSYFTSAAGVSVTPADFSLINTGNSIVLGFAAVPEPSTNALLVIGLAFLVIGYRRQNRSSRRR